MEVDMQHNGYTVERLECTQHARHVGKIAYKRVGQGIDQDRVCHFIDLAYSPWAAAASVRQHGPWKASDVNR
jgi:hypothetical protein